MRSLLEMKGRGETTSPRRTEGIRSPGGKGEHGRAPERQNSRSRVDTRKRITDAYFSVNSRKSVNRPFHGNLGWAGSSHNRVEGRVLAATLRGCGFDSMVISLQYPAAWRRPAQG